MKMACPWLHSHGLEPTLGPSSGSHYFHLALRVVYSDLYSPSHTSPLPKGHTGGVCPSPPTIPTNSNWEKVGKSSSVRDPGQSQVSQPRHYCRFGLDHILLFGAFLCLVDV